MKQRTRSGKTAKQARHRDIPKRRRGGTAICSRRTTNVAKKGSSAIARFVVDTPPENHYVIKLVNEDSKKKEIVFFVRADSNFEGKVPLGKYRVIGAYGSTWYGEKDYFGEGTTFFKFRLKDGTEVMNFYKDNTTIHGKRVTLSKVVDGNMSTPQIERAEFENN